MGQSADSPELSRKRPWFAVVLTILVPGLGHLYLRLWRRALLWLALSMLASVVFVPDGVLPDSLTTEAFITASQSVPTEGAVVLLGISLLCIVDVYLMARYLNAAGSQTAQDTETTQKCPNCGKELDPDITFCHWCTTELETADSGEE